MKRKILWFFVFIFVIIVFLPKTNAYYALEDELKKENIILNQEETSDVLGVFSIKNAQVRFNSLNVGKVESVRLYPFVFYNSLNINEANFSNNLKQFLPKNIKNLKFINTIFYPIKIWISGSGDFGELSGEVNLKTKKIRLEIDPTKNFLNSPLASQVTKQGDKYIYEITY